MRIFGGFIEAIEGAPPFVYKEHRKALCLVAPTYDDAVELAEHLARESYPISERFIGHQAHIVENKSWVAVEVPE